MQWILDFIGFSCNCMTLLHFCLFTQVIFDHNLNSGRFVSRDRMFQTWGCRKTHILFGAFIICFVVVMLNQYHGNIVNLYYNNLGDPLSWNGVPTPKNSLVNWRKVNIQRQLLKPVDWSELKRRTPPDANEMHDKWIVVTSIAAPTSDIKLLSQIPGWKLLVVGDKKTPKSWR